MDRVVSGSCGLRVAVLLPYRCICCQLESLGGASKAVHILCRLVEARCKQVIPLGLVSMSV